MSGLCASESPWHSPWVVDVVQHSSGLWLWMEATEDYDSSWFLSLKGVVVNVKMEKKHKRRLQMEGASNDGQPKGPDVLSNMNRLLSCECFWCFELLIFLMMLFFLFCSWLCRCCQMEEFCGAFSSICYCCLIPQLLRILLLWLLIIIIS